MFTFYANTEFEL